MRHGHLRQSRESGPPPGPDQGLVALRRVEVVRTYLALDDRSRFRPGKPTTARDNARIVRRAPCPVDLYRRLYKEVGEPWFWHDRLEWSDEKLAAHLANPAVSVWELMSAPKESAGFFELLRHGDGSIEIAYFGLRAAFMGRGLGALMLERAVVEAFDMRATRVWLHTCTLDSEHALPNYKARGFAPFKAERLEVDIEGNEVVGERMLSG